MWKPGRPSDAEALELLKTYVCINEPEHRRHLFELAERYARETTPPAGLDNGIVNPT